MGINIRGNGLQINLKDMANTRGRMTEFLEANSRGKIEGKGIAFWPDGRIADRRPAQWPWHFIIG